MPGMTPLAIGATFQVEAHGTALGGAAVARLPDGRVCFITGGIPGERLAIRITAIRRSFAEGELVEVLTPSPDRVEPQCAVYGRCGGCRYQHVSHPRQIALKTQQMRDAVQRIGGITLAAIDEVHAAPTPWAYRNRIALHAMADGQVGFLDGADRTAVAITTCPIARAEVNAEIPGLAACQAGTRINIRWAPGNGAVVYQGEASDALPWRVDAVADRPYSVPTGSFAQVHPAVAEMLFALVGRWLKPLAFSRVIDAYCGAGFLGLAVTDRTVFGLEIDPLSITAARANAEARGLAASHTYRAGDVEALLEAALAESAEATCVILDPPRAGCGTRTLQVLGSHKPGWILYVSCETSTLARDLKILAAMGYRVTRTALLDMFPQTAHFEAVALLCLEPAAT